MDGGVADTARANTTPVLTQAVNRRILGEGRAPGSNICARPVPHFPRMYTSSTNGAAIGSGLGCSGSYSRAPWGRNAREQQLHPSLLEHNFCTCGHHRNSLLVLLSRRATTGCAGRSVPREVS
jgi:hypothetical protein